MKKIILNCLFFGMFFSEYIVDHYWFKMSAVIKIFQVLFCLFSFLYFADKIKKLPGFVCLIIVFFSVTGNILRSEGIFIFVPILASFLIGISLAEKKIFRNTIEALNYALVFTVLIKGIRLGSISKWDSAQTQQYVAVSSSENLISADLMLFSSLTYIYFILSQYKINLFFSSFSFIVACFSSCRSGILASLAQLVLLCFYICYPKILNKQRIFIFSVFLFIILMFGNLGLLVSELKEKYESNPWTSNLRIEMWASFIQNIKPTSFLFGQKIETWDYFDTFGRNLHNSFLYLFATCGLASFILIFSLFFSFSKVWPQKKIVVLLFIPLFMRFMTDSGLFLNLFDSIFYLILSQNNQRLVHSRNRQPNLANPPNHFTQFCFSNDARHEK